MAAAAIAATVAVVQIALGEDVLVAVLFSGAAFFGLLSVLTVKLASPIGLLNILLVGRFLGGAYFAKNVLMEESIGARLQAPETTALVMFLGFAAVWLGTKIAGRFSRPLAGFRSELSSRRLLILSGIFFFAGYGSAVALRMTGLYGSEITGGVWGLLKALTPYSNIAIPTFMMYLWKTNSRKFLLNPLLLLLVASASVIGIFETGKQAMAEPLVFYLIMALARYGWRNPAIWFSIVALLAVFQSFVFPISQYVRNVGGRDLNFNNATSATYETVVSFLTDEHFRETVRQVAEDSVQTGTKSYLDPKLSAFQRIAMVGEADRLLAATNYYGEFTGLETITEAALHVVPSYLYPAKPVLGTNNFLGRYAGDLGQDDYGTQISYGFFANFYNAFGFVGVFFGSVLTVIWVSILTGLISTGPMHRDPWFLLAALGLSQSYVEQSLSGQILAIHVPIVAFVLLAATVLLDRLLISNFGGSKQISATQSAMVRNEP